jgi:2-polyprenyl-3-methyl-5-hydroxy-6-metoxy-1,4-benzoquinol methylase
LPASTYDLVTAMDVFEHLTDPLETVDALASSIRLGDLQKTRDHSRDL